MSAVRGARRGPAAVPAGLLLATVLLPGCQAVQPQASADVVATQAARCGEAQPAAAQFKVVLGGKDERAIGEKAAGGLYVRATAPV